MATIAELIAKHGWGCTITNLRMDKDSKYRDNWFRPVSFGANYYRGYSNLGRASYPDEQGGWELYKEPEMKTFYRYTYTQIIFGKAVMVTSNWTSHSFDKIVENNSNAKLHKTETEVVEV